MYECFIGLDIGTSSVRAVMFDNKGFQIGIESIEYSIISDTDGWAELDPELIFNSSLKVIKDCIGKSESGKSCIAGIGISCQMHSLMAVDSEGTPLTRLITWMDTRADKEAKLISERFNAEDLYFRTGCRVQHPMYPLSKLLWLKNNAPDIFKKAYKFITIKEYIIYKLYNQFVVDYTLASSQGYCNVYSHQWDRDMVEGILDLSTDRFSDIVECTYALKGMKPEYAGAMGIDADTPVIIGSGDGIMANLGCGVYDDTSMSSTIGTSGAIRISADKPLLDPQQRTWCYSFTEDLWVSGGAINNGGIVLKWLKEQFRDQFEHDAGLYNESIYKLFDRFADEIKPGSDGLIFLPYLTGERSPDWNAGVRGMMYGLGLSHGRKHIIRAAMEGIMYRMYSVYEVISGLRDSAVHIRANGGYAKSDVWLKMQADIFNKEILVSGVEEASALGAAYLCMLALGEVRDIKKLLPGMQPKKVIAPSPENHEIYAKAYKSAKELYENVTHGMLK